MSIEEQPGASRGPVPARTGRERRLLLRLEAFLDARSRVFVMALGLVLVLAIWTVDVVTGPQIAPAVFYLLPVALVTGRLGRASGTAVALVSALAWMGAELIGKEYTITSPIAFWNAVARFAVLVVVVSLLATVRESLKRERDLAAAEAAAAERLRETNDVKDTLLHALSHDLKGPITAILGSARSLRRKGRVQMMPEEEEALLDAITASGTKLNRLVDDLLDFERLDRGLIEPEREPTDLGAMARGLVKDADYLSEHPTRVVADPFLILVDAGKVERILENLLRNAARHTPVGTHVEVRVHEQEGGVIVSVEDEGPGIPDELKDSIFQPFRQGREARAAGSGAGIGLSLVAKFAALHAGSAWVEDRPGGGTAVRVFLPGETRPLTVAPEADVEAPTAGSR